MAECIARRVSADAASATSSASLPLPFSSPPRLSRTLPGEENDDDGRKEENNPPRKERERKRDSSPQGRSETMRASIGPLSPLSCRVELTSPGTRCRCSRRRSPSECTLRAEFRGAGMFACHGDIGADSYGDRLIKSRGDKRMWFSKRGDISLSWSQFAIDSCGFR